MFLKMFKSGRIAVKKAAPAAVTLTELAKPHPFNGLFKQSVQKDYRGRQEFVPFKAGPDAPDKPPKPVAVKPVKAKPKFTSGLDPKVLADIAALRVNAERLRDETAASVQKASGTHTPPKPSRTPKQEIAHLTDLIASSNNEHEVAALREKLAAACAAHDKLEQSNVRKGIEESARAGELSLLRGYLCGSARSCRVGNDAT